MKLHNAARAFVALVVACGASAAVAGPVQEDPSNPRWLRKDGASYFFCGPGDPESFFHRGTRNADGTRNGDQLAIISELAPSGANTLWMTAVRSHGGDGTPTENPFVNSDPAQGVSDAVLDQWEGWISALDGAGVTSFFVFYDDGTRVWDTGSVVGAQEAAFIETVVNRFEQYDHLIWNVCEEYQEAFNMARVVALAAEIDEHDDANHAIAVHQLESTTCHFPDDPIIDVFAMHCGPNNTPASLHAKVVNAWNNSAGRYHVIMSESIMHYTNRTDARKLSWAAATGGGTVFVHSLDVASTPPEALEDCARLRDFFQSTPFQSMAPADALARAQTQFAFGAAGVGYILYGSSVTGSLGLSVSAAAAGFYDLRWFDCVTGTIAEVMSVLLVPGDNAWAKPPGIGVEVALAVLPSTATTVGEGTTSASWGAIKAGFVVEGRP